MNLVLKLRRHTVYIPQRKTESFDSHYQEMGLEANAKKSNHMFISREENEDKITTKRELTKHSNTLQSTDILERH